MATYMMASAVGRRQFLKFGVALCGAATLPAGPGRAVAAAASGIGRKLTAGSALIGPGDEVLAVARAVWITVPRAVPESAGGGS